MIRVLVVLSLFAGCPVGGGGGDTDGDGLSGDVDKCPGVPEDSDGFEDADGCPEPDNDRDGVPDVDDRCPNDAENVNGVDDGDGCPETAAAPPPGGALPPVP